jgi:hypothetical protein
MSLISCGELSFVFILPIIAAILNIHNIEIFQYTQYKDHPIISCILSNTILSLFFIPFLFRKFICNKKNNSINNYKINLKVTINHPLIVMIILAILYELVNLFHIIFSLKYKSSKPYYENDIIFELCFIHFVYKLFSTKLKYKHHVVSILFILIFDLIYFAIEVVFYKIYYIFIFILLKQFIVGICLVFTEYLMKDKKYSIFLIIFVFGFIGLIIDLIILTIVTYVSCADFLKNEICSVTLVKVNEKSNMSYIENNILINSEKNDIIDLKYYLDNGKHFYDSFTLALETEGPRILILTLIFSLFSAFSIFLNFLIVKQSYPSLTFLGNIIISYYLKIREFFYDERGETYIIVIQIILITLICFWFLIYYELIELNFCGISDYTKNNRLKRNKLDERRSKNWMNNDILADADITVDKSAINVRK